MLPETYFKLKHPDNEAAQASELIVEVGQEHLMQSLAQVTPSISLQELIKYEDYAQQ